MADLTSTIETNAAAPKRFKGDEGEAEQFPVDDQIAADRYLKAAEGAAKTATRGLRFNKLVAGGAE